MTIISVIQLIGAAAGLVALAAAIIPRRPFSRWHPRGFIILLLAVLTGTHVLSSLEHMGHAALDRVIDFARLTTPILWFFLLYSWLQSDAARELTESEERFRLFMNHSPNEAFIKDEEGRYVFGNKTWQDRFGKPLEEILGKTDFDLWPPATAKLFRRTDDLTRNENRLVHELESGTAADGKPRWFDVFKFPLTNSDGKRLVAGIVHDITDMRRAELERQASDERYRLMFEHNPLPMWLYDPTTLRFIDVNAAAIAHYGYSRDEFRAMTIADIRPPEDVPRFLAYLQDPARRLANIGTWRHKKKDGTIIHVNIHNDEIQHLNRIVRITVCVDVTDRFRAEAALQESQHLLEQAQQVAHVGSWWSDINLANGKLHWSKETHRICGIPEDQFDHRLETFFNLVHPDDRERVLQASIAASHENKTYEVDHRLIRPDGQIIWVYERADVLRDSEGKPLRMVGICQDITERKRSEEALRASEERYRNIVEDQTEMIARWRPDGTLNFVNEAYARYHGKTAQEMIGVNFLVQLPEQSRKEILALIATMTPAHPSCGEERRKVMPDGREVWQSWSNRGFFDEQGRLTMVQSVGLDVTDRVKAEQALRASEKQYRTIVESTDDGIWVVDTENRTTFANRRMAQMLGVTVEEMMGRTFYEFTFAEDVPQGERNLARLKSGIAERYDFRFRRKDGSEFWVLATTNPMHNEAGEYCGAIAVISDITERKRFDDLLLQIAKGISAETDEGFFRSLIRHLTTALDVDFAFVAEFLPDDPTRLRTIAGRKGDEELGSITYSIADTPCQLTLENLQYSVASRVADQFPSDLMLQELGVQSYVGATLLSPDNKPLGVISLLSRRPIENLQVIESMLQIFAVRAAAELNRQMAEKALIESRKRLDLALRGAQLGVWDWHIPSGKVVFDKRWCEMLGYEQSEVPGDLSTWIKWAHPDDMPMVNRVLNEHLQGRIPFYSTEHRMLTKSGKWKWILDQGSVTERDESGKPIRAVGTHMDIDERKSAAAAIEEWKNRYEAAIHASRQIMYAWNSKSNEVVVAGATERLLGCQPSDLDTLEKWESRIHPDDLPAFLSMIHKVSRTFEPFELEYRFRRGDGSYLEMEDFGFFFADAQGQQTRMVGFLSDITARKEAERERRRLEIELSHKQKMEAVGNLASGIAHDFSNVLTAIQGHLSLAYRGLLPDHPAHKSLRMVEQAAQQGVDMTHSITAFARKTPAGKEPLPLIELATDSLRLFRHLLPQTIEIDYQPPADPAPWVLAARSHIQQVIMNLIVNARDAMPTGGKLSVRISAMSKAHAQMVPLISHQPPRHFASATPSDCGTLLIDDGIAVLSVTDTGCGMNDQTMARIFEPFYTTKDRQQGSGLGLAMVHGIVAEHRGWIAVESAPGKGSRFDVFMPMCTPLPPKPAATAPAAKIPAHRPRFVLVLHPDNFVGEIMTTSLESAGYVVVMARDAENLIDQLDDHGSEVGAVVVDADVLPQTDEPAVFELQKELHEMPLVVISSNMAQFLDEPLAAKLTILPKPFQMSKLISLVDRAVGVIPSGAK